MDVEQKTVEDLRRAQRRVWIYSWIGFVIQNILAVIMEWVLVKAGQGPSSGGVPSSAMVARLCLLLFGAPFAVVGLILSSIALAKRSKVGFTEEKLECITVMNRCAIIEVVIAVLVWLVADMLTASTLLGIVLLITGAAVAFCISCPILRFYKLYEHTI